MLIEIVENTLKQTHIDNSDTEESHNNNKSQAEESAQRSQIECESLFQLI